MSIQHREFITWLRDAKRLWLYVESGISTKESLDASLKEVYMTAHRLGLKAKEAVDKAARVEAERDAAHHETAVACLETGVGGHAQAQVESKLSRVQCALATSEGGRLKAKYKLDSVRQALATTKEAY